MLRLTTIYTTYDLTFLLDHHCFLATTVLALDKWGSKKPYCYTEAKREPTPSLSELSVLHTRLNPNAPFQDIQGAIHIIAI